MVGCDENTFARERREMLTAHRIFVMTKSLRETTVILMASGLGVKENRGKMLPVKPKMA